MTAHNRSYKDDLREAEADPLGFERKTTSLLLTKLRDTERVRDRLKELARAWEPRVNCPQCGHRYSYAACGFTHAEIQGLLGIGL